MVDSKSQIVCVYLELIREPHFFLTHISVAPGLDRYERHEPVNLPDFMLRLFGVLAEDHPDFLERLSNLDDAEFMKSSKHRRYVAKDRDVLYIKSPHLEHHSVPFRGYWVGTNVGSTQVESIAKLACKAADVPCASIRRFPSFAQRG